MVRALKRASLLLGISPELICMEACMTAKPIPDHGGVECSEDHVRWE